MNWNFVNYYCKERVGFITLNRPEKRNALNAQFVSELKEAFTHAEKDTDCKVIILNAKGDAFVLEQTLLIYKSYNLILMMKT